jgi:putative N6-adenine-specific DNA methylase
MLPAGPALTPRLACYAITAPGLEPITAAELVGLGLHPTAGEPGGIPFEATLDDLARANLWLRTASRIIIRLASFRVRALGELERKAAALPWKTWLPPGVPVTLRISCRKSRLYHQKAVAERLARAITGAGGVVAGMAADPAEEADDSAEPETQLVFARIFRDELSLSLDSSGVLLHRRGYRQETGKAPLRETLAAGLLLAAGWDGQAPLADPFCGSGTIPIEAALLARRIPPGRHRSFAFHRWAGWTGARWDALLAAADAAGRPAGPVIIGADRDAGAISATRANAGRAGVADAIEWRQAPLSALTVPPAAGWLISNPPYGVRVGQQADLHDLYARLGQVARRVLAGWRIALLLPAAPLERETGLTWHELFRARNGGLPVRAIQASGGAA